MGSIGSRMPAWKLRNVRRWLAVLPLLAAGAGCTWAEPKNKSVSPVQQVPTADFNVAPAQMVKVVREAVAAPPLSLPVESDEGGKVVTGWKPYRGDLHIVRYWYEQTKFTILVTPNFSDPSHKSHVQVFDQTMERAEERQPWYPAPNTHRPDRSQEVLDAISAHASQASANR